MATKFLKGDLVIPVAQAASHAFDKSSPGTILRYMEDDIYEVQYKCTCGCGQSGKTLYRARHLEYIGTEKLYMAEITGLGIGRYVTYFRGASKEAAQIKAEAFMEGKIKDDGGYLLASYLPSAIGRTEFLILLPLQEVDN